MTGLLRMSRAIDRASHKVGSLAALLVIFMVVLGALNALLRHFDRAAGVTMSSNAYIEAQWYAFALVFLLGAATTLRRDEHVRVDVFYGRTTPRVRAWIDILGTLFLMLPFCIFALWIALPTVLQSWEVNEVSPDPGGLPRFPLKTGVPVVFGMLILQGFSLLIKRAAYLRGIPGVEVPGHKDEPPAINASAESV